MWSPAVAVTLTPSCRVLRLGATDPRGLSREHGGFDDVFPDGAVWCVCVKLIHGLQKSHVMSGRSNFGALWMYVGRAGRCCGGCERPLYAASMKFDCGCGWPARRRIACTH